MYLLFVPPLEFVFVSNFILSVYLCLCTIFVYSAILGKSYKSTVISNNNNNNILQFSSPPRLRNALCKDVPRGCSHHTNQARIYLKSDTKSPRGLYSNPALFYSNGFASFDSTKEKFEVLSSSRDSYHLPLLKEMADWNTRREQLIMTSL